MNGDNTAKGSRYKKRHPGGPKGNLRPPWKEGDPSPNPGGRPREEPGFRRDCRTGAAKLLEALSDPGTYAYTTGGEEGGAGVDVAAMARAFEAIADRGGYLPMDKQAQVETAQGRLILAAMALQQLTAEQRTKLMELMKLGGSDAPSDPQARVGEGDLSEPDASSGQLTNGAANPADDGDNR